MRFLVDECLSAQLVPPLIEAGHDAIHVVGAGLQGQSDQAVMSLGGRPQDQAALVLANLGTVMADLDAGSLVVFTDLSIRVRPLPM